MKTMGTLDDEDRAWIVSVFDERYSQLSIPVDPPEPPSADEIVAAGEADAERIRAAGEADAVRIEAAAEAAEVVAAAEADAAGDPAGDLDDGQGDDEAAPDLDVSDGSAIGIDAAPEPTHWIEKPLFGRH